MPVYLEKIHNPEGQDLADLEQLYFEYTGEPASESSWLWKQLAAAGQQCYGGRFNGRLLGAMMVVEQQGDWLVEHLCVRELTRRRGFARQMLQRLQQAASSGQKIIVSDERAPEPLMQQVQFVQDGASWVWQAE